VKIDLNDLKTVILISVWYQRTLRTPCSCGRERIAERWEKVIVNDGKYVD